MVDEASKPIVVRPEAGGLDALQAFARYMIVISMAVPTILAFVKTRDLVGIIEYFKGNDGAAVMTAVVWIVTMGYGILKTWRRGSQVAAVAADPHVPPAVARLK